MKRTAFLIALCVCIAPCTQAVEILHWTRIPLSVRLIVGEERVIFMDRNVRIGVPEALSERLRVQTAGGAIYLRANAPIEPSRLQVQDAENGALVLLDIAAAPAVAGSPPLEPVRIVLEGADRAIKTDGEEREAGEHAPATPLPVALTRYAAQSLYAPLRTIEPVGGITPVPTRRDLPLETLLPTLSVHPHALAAWRLEDYWVTAIKLTHTTEGWLELDPRTLQGDFIAATFQHRTLGPAGDASDTTVLYVVTRGHGLAEAVLPAISPIDATVNVPSAVLPAGGGHEE